MECQLVDKLPRREVLRSGLQVLATVAALPLAVARVRAAQSCVEPASESLRASLHYADPAPVAAQSCSTCGFFEPGKAPCGNCMIMSGPVGSSGHCDSWAAKAK